MINLSEGAVLRSLLGDPGAVRDAEEAIRTTGESVEEGGADIQAMMRRCDAQLSLARASANLHRSGVGTCVDGRDLLGLARASVRDIEILMPLLEPVVAERMQVAIADLRAAGL